MIQLGRPAPSRNLERVTSLLALALATLTGRVLDTTTGQPLAHVRVESGASRTMTDARGRFMLRGLRPGAVTFTLESDDVPAQHTTLHLSGGTQRHDLRACSTTLDYSCNRVPSAPSGSNGAG